MSLNYEVLKKLKDVPYNLNGILSDMSSTGGASTASEISIEDSSNVFTATNVEDALLEIKYEVSAQRTRGVTIANELLSKL